jgi:hypothetical protein
MRAEISDIVRETMTKLDMIKLKASRLIAPLKQQRILIFVLIMLCGMFGALLFFVSQVFRNQDLENKLETYQ